MPQQNITTYNTNVPTLRNLQCSLSPVKCEAPPRRRKAIKQPSSRGLCLKVTLGGQIDGISGANGFHESTRRTCPRTPAASQFGNKVSFRSRCIHHVLNALSVGGLVQINGCVYGGTWTALSTLRSAMCLFYYPEL